MTSAFRRSASTTSLSRVNKGHVWWAQQVRFFSFLFLWLHCCIVCQVRSVPVWEMCSSCTVVWVQEPQSETFVLAIRSSFKGLMRGENQSLLSVPENNLWLLGRSGQVKSDSHFHWHVLPFQEADPIWTDEVSYSTAAEISGEGDPRWEEQAASTLHRLS